MDNDNVVTITVGLVFGLLILLLVGGFILEEYLETPLEECMEQCGGVYTTSEEETPCIINCQEKLASCDENYV